MTEDTKCGNFNSDGGPWSRQGTERKWREQIPAGEPVKSIQPIRGGVGTISLGLGPEAESRTRAEKSRYDNLQSHKDLPACAMGKEKAGEGRHWLKVTCSVQGDRSEDLDF